jgi:hypothetical protein
MTIGSWVRLAYIRDYSLMDDIPPVTALHDRARDKQKGQKPTSNKCHLWPWILPANTGIYIFPMDDIPPVTALYDGARRPIGSWARLAYIRDYPLMDDIPPVTALHDGARRPIGSYRNQQPTSQDARQTTNKLQSPTNRKASSKIMLIREVTSI